MLAAEMDRVAAIVARLRDEGGCPWDREQTHSTLRPYLIEEVYEVLEALDGGRMDKLREELGDLLLQVVLHAQIASEAGEFGLADVARTIADKLVRRHPHVFGDTEVDGVAGVLVNWDRIKGHEYGEERGSVLSGVPSSLPALMRAQKLQAKAAKVGFDWDKLAGPLAKAEEEFREFRAALSAGPSADEKARLGDEFGDILFALVNVARFLGLEAEEALRQTTGKFERRFRRIEEMARERGRELSQMTLAEMDESWEEAKKEELSRPDHSSSP